MKNVWPWLNILAVLLAIIVNGLANALPLNGQTTAAVSDKFPVFFVPGGFVFAIWGVIYIGWIAVVVYQALPSQRNNSRLHRIGGLFVWATLANAVWLIAWHYEFFPLTVVIMLSLLASLIAIYLRLDIRRASASRLEKWMVDVPFSIYLGWISVATIANVTDLLYYWKWDGWGIAPQGWAVIMLGVTLIIALAMALTRADVAFLLVLLWSLVGIAVKQSATPLVANSAWMVAVLVALMISMALWFQRRTMLNAVA